MQLAAYIRNLGYEATASMNDTGLVIPYALKAGLGEYARNQLVITPEFGPRLRFSKIYTTMPLAHDAPKKHGVAEVCNICTRCADACPVKAVPFDAPKAGGNQSSIKGVVKWTSDAEKCFGYWAKLASDCAICMRVCPFNRDYSKAANRWWLKLALSPLRKLALWLDDKSERAKTHEAPRLVGRERPNDQNRRMVHRLRLALSLPPDAGFADLPDDLEIKPVPVLFAGLLGHWGQLGPAEIPAKKLHTFHYSRWLADKRGLKLAGPARHPFNPLAPAPPDHRVGVYAGCRAHNL